MKTNFSEYYKKRQNIDSLLESVIIESKHNPDLYSILDEAGFFNNLAQAGSQMWKSVKDGATAAWSQMTGPATQYSNAIAALQKALGQLEKDPNWSRSATTGSPSIKSMPLLNWLKETIQELKNQQPQLANKQVAGIQTQSAQPQAGATFDPAATKFPPSP